MPKVIEVDGELLGPTEVRGLQGDALGEFDDYLSAPVYVMSPENPETWKNTNFRFNEERGEYEEIEMT